ncbi:hypothetical protein [Streptomyces sp. NBC_01022]|uniref:hypothetical protein n=1 Tax=Streptomyces sp. NBC_01022 TaxID=2903723 RepID=UPI002DD81958|nr:hypothetical protein [Streptomyces sp. NBC_01022]WRZ83257.1 hypothetical protein OG316_24915 [Streptomyces sp. NBC_01022]
MLSDSEPESPAVQAFWCERITFRTIEADEMAEIHRSSTPSPADAIRQIRLDVHSLAPELPFLERHRALSWVDGGGCIGALGSLHRGEPCGFSLSHRGAWIEWTVRPYAVVHVGDRTQLPVLGGSRGCGLSSFSFAEHPAQHPYAPGHEILPVARPR